MTFNMIFGDEKVYVKNLPDDCFNCPFSDAFYCRIQCQITRKIQWSNSESDTHIEGCPLRLKRE